MRILPALFLCGLIAPLTPATGQQQPKWPPINSTLGVTYPIDRLEGTMAFSLDAVAMASRFAGADKNIVAGPGMRLLVLTWTMTNNLQTFEIPTNGQSVSLNPYLETAGGSSRSRARASSSPP